MAAFCIVGGGHIAHSLAAKISEHEPVSVLLRPEKTPWSDHLEYVQDGIPHSSCPYSVTSTSDASVVAEADIIFVALPQFAFDDALRRIEPYLHAEQVVVLLPAPAKMPEYAEQIQAKGAVAVGFQRVPYIARTLEYGKRVSISNDRAEHRLVVSDSTRKDELAAMVSFLFGGKVFFLSSFFNFVFNNSNPLLHPSRLVVLLKDWKTKTYTYNPRFYAEWTDESSELYIAADHEMANAMSHYPEINMSEYESVLEHYGVKTASELTAKIRSIPAFQSILSPMKEENGVWIPDFHSRYFTEDVDFGTKVIQAHARKVNVQTPVIDTLIDTIDDIVTR